MLELTKEGARNYSTHLVGASSSGWAPSEPSLELRLLESWFSDASLSASELPSATSLPLAPSSPEL